MRPVQCLLHGLTNSSQCDVAGPIVSSHRAPGGQRGNMREFGVRRYGDSLYYHCMAANAADAAEWFAQTQPGLAGHDFQALVKDVARPVLDEIGLGGNPTVVSVRHGALREGARNATDLKRTSLLSVIAERSL